jgi:hypothetical protein
MTSWIGSQIIASDKNVPDTPNEIPELRGNGDAAA